MRKFIVALCLLSIIILAACGGQRSTDVPTSAQKSMPAAAPSPQPSAAQPDETIADPLGSSDAADSLADDQEINQVDDEVSGLDDMKDI